MGIPVLFFTGVGALATMASCYGCIQEPGCLFWCWSAELRLVLQLEEFGEEKKA